METKELFRLIDRLAEERRWDDIRARYDRLADGYVRTDASGTQEEFQKDHDLRSAFRWIGRLMAEQGPPSHAVHIATREYEEGRRETRDLHEALAMRPWAELDEHLVHRELRHLVAHSRVLRGEDLTGAAGLDTAVFAGVPFALQPWERASWRTSYMRTFRWKSGSGSGLPCVPLLDLELPVPIASADDTPLRAEPITGILEPSCWIEGPITVRGTAWEAAAQVMSAGTEPPTDPYHPYGAPMEFVTVYPDLIYTAGGAEVIGGGWSEARGRIALWRLLARIGGIAEPVDVAAIADVVARLRCVTWRHPDDEFVFIHLAIEDPLSGLTWVLDGQTFD